MNWDLFRSCSYLAIARMRQGGWTNRILLNLSKYVSASMCHERFFVYFQIRSCSFSGVTHGREQRCAPRSCILVTELPGPTDSRERIDGSRICLFCIWCFYDSVLHIHIMLVKTTPAHMLTRVGQCSIL